MAESGSFDTLGVADRAALIFCDFSFPFNLTTFVSRVQQNQRLSFVRKDMSKGQRVFPGLLFQTRVRVLGEGEGGPNDNPCSVRRPCDQLIPLTHTLCQPVRTSESFPEAICISKAQVKRSRAQCLSQAPLRVP